MADAERDESVEDQLESWRRAIRKAVYALPPEHRTDGATVVKLMLGQA